MSFGVYVKGSKELTGKLIYESLGTNGSQRAMMAMLFAGYAVGKFTESRRVRRWIKADNVRFYGSDYAKRLAEEAPGLPTQFDTSAKVADLRQLIAYNHDNCCWVVLAYSYRQSARALSHRTVCVCETGMRLKKIRCQILNGLCILYKAAMEENNKIENNHVIKVKDISKVSAAVHTVIANLKESCWYTKLERLAFVLAQAEERRLQVVCS